MNIFDFEILDTIPAMYYPENNLLIITDLHLGLEKTLSYKGNYIPQNQLKQMKDEIKEAKEEKNAERILINGDLKNQFKTSYSENEEVKELLNFLSFNFEEIIIVKGNHDTYLDSTLEDKGLKLEEYHLENNILFIHGDKNLEDLGLDHNFDTIVMGHEHPAIVLKDEIGFKEKVPCYLYGEMKDETNIVVMPCFSKIANGTSVNEVPSHELLSPILRDDLDIKQLRAIGISREAGLLEFPKLSKLD